MATNPAFAYALKQRVTVPNTEGIQGVIVGRDDKVKGRATYTVAWLSAEGLTQHTTYLAGEITGAGNKPAREETAGMFGLRLWDPCMDKPKAAAPKAPAKPKAKSPRKR